jgi:CubicO group peptidase (beta-lactamase class C family)
VTPRHLLSHTSGVSDEGFDDVHDFAPDLEAAVRSLSTARPVAAPGEAFHYLDTGYQALGLAMEKAAGKAYPDLLAERLFAPLGMKRSTARPEGLGVAAPVGNACFFGAALPRSLTVHPFDAPSSSVISTASDLGLYLAFLAGPEKLKRPPLSAQAARALFEPLVPGIEYGLGWYLEGEGPAKAASHSGSLEGFSSRLVLWPALKAGIALVAPQNSLVQSTFAMPALVEGARRIMFEGSVERPFPLGRLYILLAVMAFVQIFVLALQTGGALSWAKEVRDKVEASGARGPLVFAALRSWLGIALCVAIALLAPRAMSLGFGRRVTWSLAFALEPGLAAWCASACFFGILRNAARLTWLTGSRSGARAR